MRAVRVIFTGDPHVALLDPLNQGLGIEFPEARWNLEQLCGLRLVANVLGSDDSAVLYFDTQREFARRIDPAEELAAGGRDRPVRGGVPPIHHRLTGALAAPIALIG